MKSPQHESQEPSDRTDQPQTIAAVDLGSNSFRMVIARVVDDQLRLVDRLREGVRLAAYLDADQRISPEGRRRALACLKKFGQRVRDLPRGQRARGGHEHAAQGAQSRRLPAPGERASWATRSRWCRGRRRRDSSFSARPTAWRCAARRGVWWSTSAAAPPSASSARATTPGARRACTWAACRTPWRTFRDGKISEAHMQSAETAARLELRTIKKPFREMGWELAVGCSGTISAIGGILRRERLDRIRHHSRRTGPAATGGAGLRPCRRPEDAGPRR